MTFHRNSFFGWILLCCLVLTLGGLNLAGPAYAGDREDLQTRLGPGETNWIEPQFDRGDRATIVTTDLCTVLTPQAMVQTLLSPLPAGVTTSNEKFNNQINGPPAGDIACRAGGTFVGGGVLPVGPIGIPDGVVLSSGQVRSVAGGPTGATNTSPSTSTNISEPNDPHLDAIVAPRNTRDRAALEFDIVSNANRVLRFWYVFGSEEYNAWVHTRYNDACGIFVGQGVATANRALIPPGGGGPAGIPVTINNVNLGNPYGNANAVNPNHYQNNECTFGGLPPFPCAPPNRETELDGLTKDGRFFNRVFESQSVTLVAGQTYHVKLVVADTSDHIYDSALFAKGSVLGPSDLGSCCVCDVTCICLDDVTVSECDDLEGTWDAGSCGVAGCGAATGACCDDDDTCDDGLSLTACFSAGGTYAGDGTTCGASGACCFPDSSCINLAEDCCALVGGQFKGSGTNCASTDCNPTGNCCLEGVCTEPMTAVECSNAGGIYQGDGTLCVPQACEGPDEDAYGGIPAVTEWGLLVMALLGLVAGTIMFRRARRVAA